MSACIVMLITMILGVGLPRIGFDVHPNATFKSDNDASRNLKRMQSAFGADDNDLVVMIEHEELWHWDTLMEIRTLCERASQLEGVADVHSVFDLKKPRRLTPVIPPYVTRSFDPDRLKKDLLEHPIALDQLISRDGEMLVFLVRIKGGSLPVSTITQVVDPLQVYLDQFEAKTGAMVRVAGHPAVRADVLVSLRRAMFISCTVAAVMSLIVALILFRGLVPVLVVVAAPGIAAIWTFGLMAWCDVAVGGLLTALPNLVFIIGLTDAVHLLLESQRQLQRGRTSRQAAYRALMHVGPACFLTSLTTLIGFGSLALSRTSSVQSFGLWAAIGTTFAMFSVVFVLPAVILWVPAKQLCDENSGRQRLAELVSRWVAPTLRRPRLTTAIALVLCLALLFPALAQEPDIIWTEVMPHDSRSVVAMRRADEKLGGALVAYVMVVWPEGLEFPDSQVLLAAGNTQSLLKKAPKFAGSYSVLNVLAAAPGRSLKSRYAAFRRASSEGGDPLIRPDDRMLIVSARVPNDGAAALNERMKQVEADLKELESRFPGFEFVLTGTVVTASKNMNAIILDLARSLGIATMMIFVVFVLAFRSLKIGLLSIVPNALPLLVTASALTFAGLPLQITSAVTFSLCLGLAVDDTIHVIVRFRSGHGHRREASKAIRGTIRQVGPALIATTLILLAGFAAMLTSPLPGVRFFAALSGVTLITALVGDLLLFPAMLVFAYGDRGQSPRRVS